MSDSQYPKKQKQSIPRQTDFLSVPESDIMRERKPRPNTTILTPHWKLQFQIEQDRIVLPAQGELVVGRATDEQSIVALDLNPYGAYQFGVSRHHAVLHVEDGLVYLQDNNSTNGTRINGFQLTPGHKYRLRDNDELEFGRLRAVVTFLKPE